MTFYAPNTISTDVYIQFGNGDGTFYQGPAIQIPGTVTQLVAADFNGDGHLDLAAFGTASNPTCLLAVPLHDPARQQFPDLVTCTASGIGIDFNTSR